MATSKRRTHKRVEYVAEGQTLVYTDAVESLTCTSCGGTGKRTGFGNDRRVCGYCQGTGTITRKAFEYQDLATRPGVRTLCSSGATDDEGRNLTDDWTKVDCPSCRAVVWHNSPASRTAAKTRWGTIREEQDLGAVAILATVRPCGRVNLGTGIHNIVEPHAYTHAARVYFCRGEHATFKRNR